ncbi:MAG: histidine phosphatase family protein [Pyrinomonadaceae bacterium]
MKSFTLIVLAFAVFCGVQSIAAQNKTIVLVRHAEKVDATSQDPELSEAGKQRAERLVKVGGKYRPGAFYSTNFKRTRDTLAPLAAKRRKTVEIYDARKPADLLDTIMKSKIKRHIVSGHSNTVPGLANLITSKDIFKNLDETEYGVMWVIRIKDGKVVKVEVFPF